MSESSAEVRPNRIFGRSLQLHSPKTINYGPWVHHTCVIIYPAIYTTILLTTATTYTLRLWCLCCTYVPSRIWVEKNDTLIIRDRSSLMVIGDTHFLRSSNWSHIIRPLNGLILWDPFGLGRNWVSFYFRIRLYVRSSSTKWHSIYMHNI